MRKCTGVTYLCKRSLVIYSLLWNDLSPRIVNIFEFLGISETDMEWFMDPERAHVKENIISVDEDQGIHYNLRISRTAAHLLYGREVISCMQNIIDFFLY